jgi:hypothetical protein
MLGSRKRLNDLPKPRAIDRAQLPGLFLQLVIQGVCEGRREMNRPYTFQKAVGAFDEHQVNGHAAIPIAFWPAVDGFHRKAQRKRDRCPVYEDSRSAD